MVHCLRVYRVEGWQIVVQHARRYTEAGAYGTASRAELAFAESGRAFAENVGAQHAERLYYVVDCHSGRCPKERPMKCIPVQFVRATLAMLVIASVPSLAQTRATDQTNWREVKALKLGRFRSRIEVSTFRALRVVSQLDSVSLVSQEISADSARRWEELLLSEIDKPSRLKYILGNALMVEPFAAADTAGIGYVLTLADTDGVSRRMVLYRDGMQAFLDMIVKGAAAAAYLSDADLARVGPVVEKPIALAKPVNFVYPRNAKLAGLSGSAVVEFVVDPSGKAKPGTITCIQATFKDFADAAQAVVKSMEFIPATLDGHKIEQFVQYPIDFKLNAVLPIKPFPVPTRRGRR